MAKRTKSLIDIGRQRARIVKALANRMQQSRMLMRNNSTSSTLYNNAIQRYLNDKERVDKVNNTASKYAKNITQDRMLYDATKQYAQSRYVQGRVNG